MFSYLLGWFSSLENKTNKQTIKNKKKTHRSLKSTYWLLVESAQSCHPGLYLQHCCGYITVVTSVVVVCTISCSGLSVAFWAQFKILLEQYKLHWKLALFYQQKSGPYVELHWFQQLEFRPYCITWLSSRLCFSF